MFSSYSSSFCLSADWLASWLAGSAHPQITLWMLPLYIIRSRFFRQEVDKKEDSHLLFFLKIRTFRFLLSLLIIKFWIVITVKFDRINRQNCTPLEYKRRHISQLFLRQAFFHSLSFPLTSLSFSNAFSFDKTIRNCLIFSTFTFS